MNPAQQELWQRLQDYSFDDDPAAALPFRARLARENRWSLAFAGSAITEYKRFAFLAVAAGHPVTPSDQIDQVWHLHLLYTRTYWEDFCPRVLGKALHHGPTRGGAAEGQKFDDWYARTQESYRSFFGEDSPADLWPDASLRFGRDIHFARINTQGHWVIPKPAIVGGVLRRALGFISATGVLLVAGTAHGALPINLSLLAAAAPPPVEWNPLNFRGPQFLGLYLILMAVAVIAAVIYRNEVWKSLSQQSERDAPAPGTPDPALDTTEIAYLAGEDARAVEAAVVSLLQGGQLKLEADRSIGHSGSIIAWPAATTDLERAVYDAASTQHDVRKLKKAARVVAVLRKVRQRLDVLGLTLDGARRQYATWKVRLVVVAPLLLGATKILVGISRDRPVGFLVMLCVVTIVLASLFPEPTLATQRGVDLLERLRQRYGNMRTPSILAAIGGPITGVASSGALALGVGLFGASALAGNERLQSMHHALYPPSGGDGGSDGSSSGCGGGGCGGGGCGGCSS